MPRLYRHMTGIAAACSMVGSLHLDVSLAARMLGAAILFYLIAKGLDKPQ
jgi:hypothetical protein